MTKKQDAMLNKLQGPLPYQAQIKSTIQAYNLENSKTGITASKGSNENSHSE